MLAAAAEQGMRALRDALHDVVARGRALLPRPAEEPPDIKRDLFKSLDRPSPDIQPKPASRSAETVPDRDVPIEAEQRGSDKNRRTCVKEALFLMATVLDECRQETANQSMAALLAPYCSSLGQVGIDACRELLRSFPSPLEMAKEAAEVGDGECIGPLKSTRDALNQGIEHPLHCEGLTDRTYGDFEARVSAARPGSPAQVERQDAH